MRHKVQSPLSEKREYRNMLERSLGSLLNSWLRYLGYSCGLSHNTIHAYSSDMRQLLLFLRDYKGAEVETSDIAGLTKSNIRAWFLARRNAGETARTLARGLSAVKSLVKYLIDEKVIEDCEVLTMRPPKLEKSLPRPLTIAQLNDVISALHRLKRTSWMVKRDKALLVLIYSVGLRISEALSIDRRDIANSSGALNILGKGGKARVVPLVEPVKAIIDDYLDACEFKLAEALFVNNTGGRLTASAVQKLVKKAREWLGLSDKVTPHALRHSCATHLMENTGDLRGIQELLGHSSISSTQIYADVAKKYITEIYDKCHPLSGSGKREN